MLFVNDLLIAGKARAGVNSLATFRCGLLLGLTAFLPLPGYAAPALKTYNIDLERISVSGLSSGGYMAVQFQVAYSSLVKGAGIIAGGPYFCAQDSQETATGVCSCPTFSCLPDEAVDMVPDLVQITDQNANQGAIDPTSNLSNDRVWMFSGSNDSVVPTPVMDALEDYYGHYISGSNIFFERGVPAEHAMPTDSFGKACGFKGDPFINNCNFDAAGELLKWIYGDLAPQNSGTLSGEIIEFDQGEFIPNPTADGMWQSGWVYVPASCQQGDQCKLHVVFHGCKQYPGALFPSGPNGKIGDTYVKNTGYNEWADTNDIVVLYPQANALTTGTRPTSNPFINKSNPLGCWDWWGYDDADYAEKGGPQMAAVKSMMDRLAGAAPDPDPTPDNGFCDSATNADHVSTGRAYLQISWWFWTSYHATGSDDYLGWLGSTTTALEQTSPGQFSKVASCP